MVASGQHRKCRWTDDLRKTIYLHSCTLIRIRRADPIYSADYDSASNLTVIDKPMLTINFADDLTNPPQFLHMPTASNYTSVLIPGGFDSYGHMTIAHPAVWASFLQSFLQHLPLEALTSAQVSAF